MPARSKRLKIRAVGHGGGRGEVGGRKNDPLLDFDKSVNPIPTGREDYAHKINPRPPGFSDLPAALKLKWIPAWLLI